MPENPITPTTILRSDLLRYCHTHRLTYRAMARLLASHGANYHTANAFLKRRWHSSFEVMADLKTAFEAMGGEVSYWQMMAALMGLKATKSSRVKVLTALLLQCSEAERRAILQRLELHLSAD